MTSPLWVYLIGFVGMALYGVRLFVQWYMSEKHKTVESPTLYWVFSAIGSMIMFLYGCLRNDFAIIFGEFLTFYIFMWNLKAKGVYGRLPRFVPIVQALIPVAALLILMRDIPEFAANYLRRDDVPLPLMLFGMAGLFTFKSRFLYQWIYSVRHTDSSLPRGCWIIAVAGSVMIITYGAIRHDWVLIVGQLGIIVSIRNIMIALKYDRKKISDAETTDR